MAYSIHDSIILRSPRFSLDAYFQNSMKGVFNSLDDQFLEAIYVASPALYNVIKTAYGNKTTEGYDALFRYFTRASFRPTPFGLFAGISVVNWESRNEIIFNEEIRHTSLSMECTYEIAVQLSRNPTFQSSLKYVANNTIYTVGNWIRYVEYIIKDRTNHFVLSQAELSEELELVLASSCKPVKHQSLVDLLVSTGIDNCDACNYINSLIENQILLSELEPSITVTDLGRHLLCKLSETYQSKEINTAHSVLQSVYHQISLLDKGLLKGGNHYEAISNTVAQLLKDSCEKSIFKIDLFKTTKKNALDARIKTRLHEGLEILLMLCSNKHNERLDKFKSRFQERYENSAMPLLEVLDSDIGIGYLDPMDHDVNLLTKDIDFPESDYLTISLGNTTRWLFKKLQYALLNNLSTINIEKEELQSFGLTPHWDFLPSTFSMYFRVTNFRTNELYIDSVGGPSAIRAIGRFAYIHSKIDDLIKDIIEVEESSHPNSIIAEIIHLPQTSFGNALTHRPFYHHELTYFSCGSDETEKVPPEDLLIKIESNRIKLFSKKLKKEVVPRLSNAHNHELSPLPVYNFLCDLQSQGKHNNVSFDWGPLKDDFLYLPRVCSGSIILKPATWNLGRIYWQDLIAAKDEELVNHAFEFRDKWRIPRFASLTDYDQELVIDFENIYSIRAFLGVLSKREQIVLKEYLFDSDSQIKNENGQRFVGEFVASVIRNDEKLSEVKSMPFSNIDFNVQDSFIPGSEWVYLKLYCSSKSIDTILVNAIKPLSERLLEQKIIDKWFFIRYKDVDHHIRFRVHLQSEQMFGEVVALCNSMFQKFISQKLIWKIQYDTYIREVERYGNISIDETEAIFFYSSVCVTKFLSIFNYKNESDIERWLWAIKSVDKLLADFNLCLQEKQQLIQELRESYQNEFNLKKASRLQLDKKYRKLRHNINSALSCTDDNDLYKPLDIRSANMEPIITKIIELKECGHLKVSINELVKDYLHMEVNRIIPFSQRLHELIIYDFIYRYYSSQLARQINVHEHIA